MMLAKSVERVVVMLLAPDAIAHNARLVVVEAAASTQDR
jgi:hypothetical protein